MGRTLAFAGLLASFIALAPTAASARPHVYGPPGSTSQFYTNVSGDRVHRPMTSSQQPAGATAKCRDGTWSFSQHHRGTCSYHGGVASWL